MRAKRYSHLNNTVKMEYNWESNLLKRSLPSVFFANIIVGNFLFGIERLLSICYSQIRKIDMWSRIE